MAERKRVRRAARRAYEGRRVGTGYGKQPERRASERGAVRSVICGVIFVLLIALKLVMPDNLGAFRGTLGQWLVRDADFAEAFSQVGRAVSGQNGAIDSLGRAYRAVFGAQEAQEVSGSAEELAGKGTEDEAQSGAASPEDNGPAARDLPANASAERKETGFAFAPPVSGAVTSPFGWRAHPASGAESFHYGVDLAAEEGDPVTAFADGTVGVVGESTELGRYLTVNHANGFSTLYAHCSAVTAASGEQVALGQKIAEAGKTGNATGPHLHFELHEGEIYLDPQLYFGA